MIDARHRHATLCDSLSQVPQSPEVRNIQHHNDIGLLDVPYGLSRLVRGANAIEQEPVPLRERGGIGDDRPDPILGQEAPQPNLTPGSVSISIHMGREGDPDSRLEQLGYLASRLRALGDRGNHGGLLRSGFGHRGKIQASVGLRVHLASAACRYGRWAFSKPRPCCGAPNRPFSRTSDSGPWESQWKHSSKSSAR